MADWLKGFNVHHPGDRYQRTPDGRSAYHPSV